MRETASSRTGSGLKAHVSHLELANDNPPPEKPLGCLSGTASRCSSRRHVTSAALTQTAFWRLFQLMRSSAVGFISTEENQDLES
jgi:hypothetical protein